MDLSGSSTGVVGWLLFVVGVGFSCIGLCLRNLKYLFKMSSLNPINVLHAGKYDKLSSDLNIIINKIDAVSVFFFKKLKNIFLNLMSVILYSD